LHRAVPDESIEPVTDAGPEGVEANDRGGVEGVDVIGIAEDGEDAGLEFAEGVGGFGGLDGLASVEVPAEAETEEDQQGRGDHDRDDARLGETCEAECSGFVLDEGLEPRPGRRSDEAEEHGE
jgi:hypothetical protein